MKYECESNGSTSYNGKRIRYTKGENDVPEGSLDHVGGCKMISKSDAKQAVVTDSEKRDKPLDGTVKEIKKWLDDHGVDYKSNALKADLIEILEEA